MRKREFTTVQLKQTGPQQVAVLESKITIDLDAICGLAPATIPSELKGPNGEGVSTPACTVFFSGGQFTVRETYEVMQVLWEDSNEVISG